MDPVDGVVGTGGVAGVVGAVVDAVAVDVATAEAEEKGDALKLEADAVNAGSSAMEAVEVTYGESVCDDCTYPSFEVEHFCQLDYSSTNSKVHRKFLPLALRWVIRERALEVAMTLMTVGCSLPAAVVPTEVELSAEAWR